jgi:hypothetical protein
MMAREDRQARREETELAERAQDRAEAEVTRALLAGRDVSLQGAFGRAARAAVKTDYQAAKDELKAKVEAGEVEVLDGTVRRAESRYPGSDYEVDRQIRRAGDLRADLAAYRVRHGGAAAVEAARSRRDELARRSVPMIYRDGHGREIER